MLATSGTQSTGSCASSVPEFSNRGELKKWPEDALVIAEVLRANDVVHVGLHELLDEVDLLEAVVRRRLDNVEDRDDLLSLEGSAQARRRGREVVDDTRLTFSDTPCSAK